MDKTKHVASLILSKKSTVLHDLHLYMVGKFMYPK